MISFVRRSEQRRLIRQKNAGLFLEGLRSYLRLRLYYERKYLIKHSRTFFSFHQHVLVWETVRSSILYDNKIIYFNFQGIHVPSIVKYFCIIRSLVTTFIRLRYTLCTCINKLPYDRLAFKANSFCLIFR